MKKLILVLAALTAPLFFAWTPILAAPLFTDDFNSGSSTLWGNEIGNWYASEGVYNANSPSNNPTTYTSLPYNLRDFTFEVDMNSAGDGGIWLRSGYTPQSGFSGVLLVVGGSYTQFDGMYFHTFEPGNFGTYGQVDNLFTPGQDLHVKVVVSGDTYTAYLYNTAGGLLGTTFFTDDSSRFYSGRVGLYDFGPGFTEHDLKFDNVSITGSPIPLPGAVWLLGSGLLGLGLLGYRRKQG